MALYPFWVYLVPVVGGFYVYFSFVLSLCLRPIGWRLRRETEQRRELLLARVATETKDLEDKSSAHASLDDEWEKIGSSRSQSSGEIQPNKQDSKWEGIVGFFHPFCNAGGGGERVLWAAIRTTQQRWPNAVCVVYTGDHDVNKEQILKRVEERFNIHLYPPTVVFLYLSTRQYVLSTTWPHFTLLGQSVGSLVLAHDAFSLLVPDIFIDTMGYAFALALCKAYFPGVPTSGYVHYPTISTDMLGSLDATLHDGKGVHAGLGNGWRGTAKKIYWRLFARLYSWVGGSVDVVMTNSSWTQRHMQQLWGPARMRRRQPYGIEVVFPPCAVEELEKEINVSSESEKKRQPTLLYIAQFRPEKNHQLVLRAFADLLSSKKPVSAATAKEQKKPQLLLIGSVRDSGDETYIYSLRLLAHELHITDLVTFSLNASWPTILSHLRTSSIGINAMYNEHFGIGVVEYAAAGLICVVNNSGGPKRDICIKEGEGPTGFHASTQAEYAAAFTKALSLSPQEALNMRLRARKTSRRFNEAAFDERWRLQMDKLIKLQESGRKPDTRKQ